MPFIYVSDKNFQPSSSGQAPTPPDDGRTFDAGSDNINTYTDEDGREIRYAGPRAVDFSSLEAPFVPFGPAFEFARGVGQENRNTYFRNLGQARDAALGLVDTDVQGITNAVTTLAPFARQQGNQDLDTNIFRAGEIDAFNLSRLPGFNQQNRQAADQANAFNISQHQRAIESSGLNYRNRLNETIGRLSERAQGRLPAALDDAITTDLRNRGSDLVSGSGVSPVSRAGIRAGDRLTVSERLQLSLDADRQLPGVLTQGQQVLQAPIERAPTAYAQPTPVPLNPSQVEARTPLTSNVSAGAAQQAIGTQATNWEVIPATTALSARLSTDQFNEQARYARDATVLQGEQAILTAEDTALQGAINAARADRIRDEAYNAYQQGLDVRERADTISGIGSVLGGAASLFDSLNLGGSSGGGGGGGVSGVGPISDGGQYAQNVERGHSGGFIDTVVSGAQDFGTAIADGFGQIYDTASNALSNLWRGQGQQAIPIGNASIPVQSFQEGMDNARNFFRGGGGGPQLTGGGGPQDFVREEDSFTKSAQQTKGGGKGEGPLDTGNPLHEYAKPVRDLRQDAQNVDDAAQVLANPNLPAHERLRRMGNLGTRLAAQHGVLDPSQARGVSIGVNSLATLANPEASTADRASAIAAAASQYGQTQFTGTPDAPITVSGQRVVESRPSDNGDVTYTLEDGSTATQSELRTTANTTSAINAFSILNSDASDEEKLEALTRVGIDAARANNIISQVAGGNMLAGLSLFQTTTNWDQMNNFQRAVSVMSTGEAVSQAASAFTSTGAAGSVNPSLAFFGNSGNALSSLSNVLGVAGVGAMVAMDTMRGVDIFQGLQNLGTSEGIREGTSQLGGVISGLDKIPGVSNLLGEVSDSNVGTAALMLAAPMTLGLGGLLGGIASQFGTGKNDHQQARDSWRSVAEQMGVMQKNPQGSHVVQLADGSSYDIGRDGGHRLQNVGENIDGKEDRFTYEVDWSNQTAVDSIPEAHIFAIATGLDPTSNQDQTLFHRAVAQGLNAATSNANTVQGVRDNFRAMMKNVDPASTAMRIETLRAANKISEQEYGVYLDRMNKIFGTELTPSDPQKARQSIISSLQQMPADKLPKPQKKLLDLLTNPKELEKARNQLETRIQKERKNRQSGGKGRGPLRERGSVSGKLPEGIQTLPAGPGAQLTSEFASIFARNRPGGGRDKGVKQ